MTLEKVKSTISQLETIDPNEEYAYEKALIAFIQIGQLPCLTNSFTAGTIVCRTRTHEIDNLFPNLSDISIAPNYLVKNYQRCNKPFQSKFYCAENRPTSYFELVDNWIDTKEPGDILYVTIGRWRIKTNLNYVIITTPDNTKRISEYHINNGKILDAFLETLDGDFKDAVILLYSFLFEHFSKPAKNDLRTYIITTAYSNLILSHSNSQADAICYPSVPFCEQGINWAINQEFIKPENIELLDSIKNNFKVIEKKSFEEIGLIGPSKIDLLSGNIDWTTPTNKSV